MMIEVNALTKRFADVSALSGIDIHVPKGSIYGLVGPNGSGKTTLIKHIMGILKADSGTMRVAGQEVYENPAVKERMAYVSDQLYFFHSASLLDMRRFYKRIYPAFDDALFQKLQAAFPHDIKKPLRSFSKGMQKQAAIWLALSLRPDLMVLDEPIDGLDPVMRRSIWSLILQEVAERELTVFISSHNLRELEDVCDHVGIMHQGKMLLERNLSELQSTLTKLQIAFDGDAPPDMNRFDALHASKSGRIYEYILRGNTEDILENVSSLCPILAETLPLTLEEIFIYELGGMDYAEIIL